MSQSKIDCPICARELGETHTDDCPRSAKRLGDVRRGQRLYRLLCRRRFVWRSSHLVEVKEPGAVLAISRSKQRGVGPYPIEGLRPGKLIVKLYRVLDDGTYERKQHGPLPTMAREVT